MRPRPPRPSGRSTGSTASSRCWPGAAGSLGAYALYLVAVHGVNPFAAIAAAALVAAVISMPVSVLVLRLSGGYFAVATLVVAAVFQIAATLSPSVGGTTGVTVPAWPATTRCRARR